jgi:hypothetical protein
MELNGALSNHVTDYKLSKLGAICTRLLRKAAVNPLELRPAPVEQPSVVGFVLLALEQSERPMRATEIFEAACKLADERLVWSTVKSALSAGSKGERPRFRRIGWGVYEAAGLAEQCELSDGLQGRGKIQV